MIEISTELTTELTSGIVHDQKIIADMPHPFTFYLRVTQYNIQYETQYSNYNRQ